jgi:hypothetical protein
MKKSLLLTGVLLALTASMASAQGGISLAWNTCLPNGGAINRAAVCDESGVNSDLHATFRPGGDYPNFTSLDATLTVTAPDGSLPDYWRFDQGCRGSSIVVATGAGANAANCPSPWTGQTLALTPNYTVTPSSITIRFAIGSTSTTNLTDRPYHAFRIRLDDTGAGGGCPGCNEPVCIQLNQITTETEPPTAPRTLTSPDAVVSWNGANCMITPTQNKSWGQIKALFR